MRTTALGSRSAILSFVQRLASRLWRLRAGPGAPKDPIDASRQTLHLQALLRLRIQLTLRAPLLLYPLIQLTLQALLLLRVQVTLQALLLPRVQALPLRPDQTPFLLLHLATLRPQEVRTFLLCSFRCLEVALGAGPSLIYLTIHQDGVWMHLLFWDASIVDLSIGLSIQVNAFVSRALSIEVPLLANLQRCWSS